MNLARRRRGLVSPRPRLFCLTSSRTLDTVYHVNCFVLTPNFIAILIIVFSIYYYIHMTDDIFFFPVGWVKVVDAINSTLVKAKLSTGNYTHRHCIGSALVNRQGCWFFLKGGFVLDSTYNTSLLYFQVSGDGADQNLSISVASASLQPFTDFQWRKQQQDNIATVRTLPTCDY